MDHERTRTDGLDIPPVVVEEANEDEHEAEEDTEHKVSFPAWLRYYERRQQVCYRHALLLESMLEESPANRPWLEQYGFNVDKLVRYLRWNPAEQLRQLEHMEPGRRARYSKQLHAEHRRNIRHMEENIEKVLPLFDDIQSLSQAIAKRRAQRKRRTLDIEELEVFAAGCSTGETESLFSEAEMGTGSREPLDSVDSDSLLDS
ncbi:hypothetical protein PsYK624_044640 [Phanerochaete sordida]|uniref:Uncharacterized protein n=1 Tax=Phanerochaete sordida TaxID=48140 RepID=A0A9P3G519_9APHY|nr:hypothetical protein PsYK624_044640 [Phanerochaete sordida]